MIEYPVQINGLGIDALYSERAAEEIFLPLLKRMTEMRIRKGKRILVMLGAPPGAGKTTLSSFLGKLSRETPGLLPIRVLGMDGFHKKQEYLTTHFTDRDGERIPLVRIKGAPVTFDLHSLTERVKRVASGEECPWPEYDRLLHDPVEDAVKADRDIILIEGIYLLLDAEGWRDLSTLADLTISVTADEGMLRERLIDRRVRLGEDQRAAAAFVDFSDMPNLRLCLAHALPADIRLKIDQKGDYFLL